jgi:hypothetical protein
VDDEAFLRARPGDVFPAVDRVSGLGAFALGLPQPAQACDGPRLVGLSLRAMGYSKCLLEAGFDVGQCSYLV